MSIINNIFLNYLPSIDLHGYDRETAKVALDDFLEENIYMKKKKIVIIHGKGTGVIKSTVHNELKKNKYVDNFYLDGSNTGCTIVNLK